MRDVKIEIKRATDGAEGSRQALKPLPYPALDPLTAPWPSLGPSSGITSQLRLSGGYSGHRYPIGRAGDIVQTRPMKEINRIRLPPVFAANAQFQIGIALASPAHAQIDQLAHAFFVQPEKRGQSRRYPSVCILLEKKPASSLESP